MAIVLIALMLTACSREGESVAWSFERMIDQPSLRAYEPSDFFADSMGMRTPPPGTVPRGELLGPRVLVTGRTRPDTAITLDIPAAGLAEPEIRPGPASTRIPIPLTITDVRRGQDRFDIFCAACHGVDGRARTPVADNMTLRRPADLTSERIRGLADGQIYAVVNEGYGFMPSYAAELSVHDRWAVVAYVRALQLSQAARLSELPAPVQREFRLAVPDAGVRP